MERRLISYRLEMMEWRARTDVGSCPPTCPSPSPTRRRSRYRRGRARAGEIETGDAFNPIRSVRSSTRLRSRRRSEVGARSCARAPAPWATPCHGRSECSPSFGPALHVRMARPRYGHSRRVRQRTGGSRGGDPPRESDPSRSRLSWGRRVSGGPTMLELALGYARDGHAVLPLYEPVRGGCSCGEIDCRSAGKHPRTRAV
jgi:hypothetical protein